MYSVCAPCPAAARWSLCAPQVAAGRNVRFQFYNFIIGGRGSLFDGGGKWGAYKYFVLKLTQLLNLHTDNRAITFHLSNRYGELYNGNIHSLQSEISYKCLLIAIYVFMRHLLFIIPNIGGRIDQMFKYKIDVRTRGLMLVGPGPDTEIIHCTACSVFLCSSALMFRCSLEVQTKVRRLPKHNK